MSRETAIPRCDLCHQVTHRSRLRVLLPEQLEQAPLDLCPRCWKENEATASWWQARKKRQP